MPEKQILNRNNSIKIQNAPGNGQTAHDYLNASLSHINPGRSSSISAHRRRRNLCLSGSRATPVTTRSSLEKQP